jgi:mono/diheme cytochrome c family protein
MALAPAVFPENNWVRSSQKSFTRRRSLKTLIRSIIKYATASVLVALCSSGAWAADAAAGKAVYNAKCRGCHGANGEGNPSMAKVLKVEFKPLSESTADVKKVITEGQGKMRPVSGLGGADLDNVVAYVQSLKK